MHWTRWQRTGDPLKTKQPHRRRHVPVGTHLLGRVVRRPKSNKPGCWFWTGALNGDGYGIVSIDGRLLLTHRVAYELFVGPIPDGHEVCHRCDNPQCCKPAHLFVGTRTDNAADMWAKGRGVTPTTR